MRTAFVVLLVLIAGCEKSSEKKTIEGPDGTVEVGENRIDLKMKDGTVVVAANKVPDGFKIPVMQGAEIENSTHMSQPDGLEVFQLSFTTSAAVSEVAVFYEKWFKDRGISVTRSEQSDKDTTTVMLFGSADGLDANAMVLKEHTEDRTSATISWSEKKK